MNDTEEFLPNIVPPPVQSDRDVATAGVIAITATCSAPVTVIAVWRALL